MKNARKKMNIGLVIFLLVLGLYFVISKSRNPHSNINAEKVGGTSYEATDKVVLSKTPIIEVLPFESTLYKISYGLSPTKKSTKTDYAIYITTANETDKQYALQWMTEHSYNPKNYEIIYIIDSSYRSTYVKNLSGLGD